MAQRKVKAVKFGDVESVSYPKEVIQRLITKQRDSSDKMSLSVVTLEAGYDDKSVSQDKDEIIYWIEGKGKLSWEGGEADIKPGTAVFIPAGSEYRLQTTEKNFVIAVFSPPVQ